MRIGVIGLGNAAEHIHLPACRSLGPAVESVVGCDPDETRRQRIGELFPLSSVHETADEMFREAEPDLVIVGTPPTSHGELSIQALENGAHVLCEKPFAATVDAADRIIKTADERGLAVRVNTQYRYMRIYNDTEAMLRRGDFGRPYFLQCWQQMHHPNTAETNWRADLRRSTLFEFGTHALDLIAFFFDDLPESIYANISGRELGFDSDVLVQATLRFPENRVATIAFNRVSHAPERYLEMRVDCETASLRVSLGGVARATAEWSSRRGGPTVRANLVRGGVARAERDGRSRMIARERRQAFATATTSLLADFVAAIESGDVSNDSARHSREILAAALAGYDSAESGQPVDLRAR